MGENISEKVQVAIRWRPLLRREQGALEDWVVHPTSVVLNSEHGEKEWTFDKVFDEHQQSNDVYEHIVKPIVDKAIKGYNGTVFAYGQTGSGKTFTMRGNAELPGIIPLTVDHLLATFEATPEREFMIGMIYIEIYNEKIKNLLTAEERKITVKEETETGNFELHGVDQKLLSTKDEIMALLVEGDRRRAVAATNMNEHSSRSHAIFRLTVESREIAHGSKSPIMKSQLNLVDLAGSEKAAQTGASGQTLKEGAAINKSLFMLGRVINELTQGAHHISYRDSVLTRILQPALGGNAKTAIIATATRANVQETKSTLLFADGAKKMKNKVRQNESLGKEALIHRQAKEIKELKLQLDQNQVNGESEKVSELEERIKHLHKMFINNVHQHHVQEPVKKSIRRYTLATTTQLQPQLPAVKRETISTMNEEDGEWTSAAVDVLDRLDQDRELRQIDLNRSGNEKKRTRQLDTSVSDEQPKPQKRHKSLNNVASTVAYLDDIEFDDLNKENFDELKTKVRKSVYTNNDEHVDELRETLKDKDARVAQLEEELAKAATDAAILAATAEQQTTDAYTLKMERLEAKLAAMGDRKSVDELINQTMALHSELKQKSQLMVKLEETHSAEKSEFKTITDELHTQLITLKEALEKVESEKTMMLEASMTKLETLDVGIITDETDEKQAINDALDMNILLDERVKELEKSNSELEAQLSKAKTPTKGDLTRTQCDLCEFSNDEKKIIEEEMALIAEQNAKLIEDQLKLTQDHSEQTAQVDTLTNQIEQLKLDLAETKQQLMQSGAVDIDSMTEMLIKAQKAESVMKLKLEMAEETATEAEAALAPSKIKIEQLEESLAKLEVTLKESNERDARTIDDLQFELSMARNGTARIEHSLHIPVASTADAEIQTSGTTTTDTVSATELSLAEIDALQAQLEEALVARQAHEEQMQLKTDEIAELETQQKTLCDRVAELEGDKQQADSQLIDANSKLERINELEQKQAVLQEQLGEMEATKQAFTDQVCQLQKSGTDLEGQVQLKTELIAQLEAEKQHADSQLIDANSQSKRIDELEQAQAVLHEQLSEVEANKQALTDQVCQLQKSGTDLEGHVQLKTELIAQLEAEKKTQNDQIELSRLKLADELTNATNALEDELKNKESNENAAAATISMLEESKQTMRDELDQLRLAHDAICINLDDLKTTLTLKEGELDQMRNLTDERTTQLATNLTRLEKENDQLKATKPEKTTTDSKDSDKLSKSQMEELGIEEDSETVESQTQADVDITESVEECECRSVIKQDVATQCEHECRDVSLNTSTVQVNDQNTSVFAPHVVETSMNTSTVSIEPSRENAAVNTSTVTVPTCDMQTSMLHASTNDVGINTGIEVVTRDEFETIQKQLTEATLKLEQSQATVTYLEGQLEGTREQPEKRSNISLSMSASDARLVEFEQQLTVEKQKLEESHAIFESLKLRNEELNQFYIGEKHEKDNAQSELNKIKAEIGQCQAVYKSELERLETEIADERAKLAPLSEELIAVRKQRTEYVDKFKESCDTNNEKDGKLQAAAEMFQSHRQQIQQLETEKNNLMAQLDEIKQSIASNEQEQAAHEAMQSTLERHAAELQAKFDALETETINLRARCSSLDQLEKEVEDFVITIQNQTAQLKEKEANESLINVKTEQIVKLQGELSSVTTDCRELANTLSGVSAECDGLKRELKEKSSEVVAKEDMIMEKKNKISQLQADIMSIQTNQQLSANNNNEVKQLREALETSEMNKQSIIQKATKNEELLKETQDEYKKMVKALDELEQNENELKLKLNQATIEKNKAIGEADSLKKQGAIFKNEYTTMESELASITQKLDEKSKLAEVLEQQINEGGQELKRLNNDKKQLSSKLEEKEAKYTKLTEAYTTMRRDYNQIKDDKKRCALPENLAIADVKEKLKKYYKLYQEAKDAPCEHCGKKSAGSKPSTRSRSVSAAQIKAPSSSSSSSTSLATSSKTSGPVAPLSPNPKTKSEPQDKQAECKQQ